MGMDERCQGYIQATLKASDRCLIGFEGFGCDTIARIASAAALLLRVLPSVRSVRSSSPIPQLSHLIFDEPTELNLPTSINDYRWEVIQIMTLFQMGIAIRN